MARARRWAVVAVTVAAAAAMAPAPPAAASGIGAPMVGGAWATVTAKDPSAIHFNPAMLAHLTGVKLQLNAAVLWAHASYQREYRAQYQFDDSFKFALPLEPTDLDPGKAGFAEPVDANVILPLGSAFVTWSPVDRLVVGLGVYAVHGAGLAMDDDGPQRYQVQEALLMGLHLTPSIAYKVADWLQVGAGVNVVAGTINLRQVVDLAGTPLLADALAEPPLSQPNDFGDDAPPGVRELDVLSRPATLETMAWGVSFNVGLAFVPHPDWTVGLTYQHGADLVFEGDAALDMNHDFFTTDLAFKGLAYPAIVKGKAFIEFPFPASLRLGVGWQVSEAAALEVMASWVRWSVLKALNVTIESQDLAQPELGLGPVTKISLPRDALDTVEVEAVFGYQLDTDVRLGLRAGYHSPFSPDDTLDMASVDGHRVLGAVMADYKVSDAITLSGHVAFQFMLPREVVSSRHDRANGTYDLFILNAGGALSFSL